MVYFSGRLSRYLDHPTGTTGYERGLVADPGSLRAEDERANPKWLPNFFANSCLRIRFPQ